MQQTEQDFIDAFEEFLHATVKPIDKNAINTILQKLASEREVPYKVIDYRTFNEWFFYYESTTVKIHINYRYSNYYTRHRIDILGELHGTTRRHL